MSLKRVDVSGIKTTEVNINEYTSIFNESIFCTTHKGQTMP